MFHGIWSQVDSLPKGIGDKCGLTLPFVAFSSQVDLLPKGIGDHTPYRGEFVPVPRSQVDLLPKGIGDTESNLCNCFGNIRPKWTRCRKALVT